jgi:hypothetical protein
MSECRKSYRGNPSIAVGFPTDSRGSARSIHAGLGSDHIRNLDRGCSAGRRVHRAISHCLHPIRPSSTQPSGFDFHVENAISAPIEPTTSAFGQRSWACYASTAIAISTRLGAVGSKALENDAKSSIKSRVGQRFLGQRIWVCCGCNKGFQGFLRVLWVAIRAS